MIGLDSQEHLACLGVLAIKCLIGVGGISSLRGANLDATSTEISNCHLRLLLLVSQSVCKDCNCSFFLFLFPTLRKVFTSVETHNALGILIL